MLTFISSLGFLLAAQLNKDQHPQNLYYLGGFTISMAWSVAVVCARFYEGGMGKVVLEAVGLTACASQSRSLDLRFASPCPLPCST